MASYEDNARRFLFPEPKLVPSFSGTEQEVLMTRAPHFSVSSTLKELMCDLNMGYNALKNSL